MYSTHNLPRADMTSFLKRFHYHLHRGHLGVVEFACKLIIYFVYILYDILKNFATGPIIALTLWQLYIQRSQPPTLFYNIFTHTHIHTQLPAPLPANHIVALIRCGNELQILILLEVLLINQLVVAYLMCKFACLLAAISL